MQLTHLNALFLDTRGFRCVGGNDWELRGINAAACIALKTRANQHVDGEEDVVHLYCQSGVRVRVRETSDTVVSSDRGQCGAELPFFNAEYAPPPTPAPTWPPTTPPSTNGPSSGPTSEPNPTSAPTTPTPAPTASPTTAAAAGRTCTAGVSMNAVDRAAGNYSDWPVEPTSEACASRCRGDAGCHLWTWHAETAHNQWDGGGFSLRCVTFNATEAAAAGRTDPETWLSSDEGHHISGTCAPSTSPPTAIPTVGPTTPVPPPAAPSLPPSSTPSFAPTSSAPTGTPTMVTTTASPTTTTLLPSPAPTSNSPNRDGGACAPTAAHHGVPDFTCGVGAGFYEARCACQGDDDHAGSAAQRAHLASMFQNGTGFHCEAGGTRGTALAGNNGATCHQLVRHAERRGLTSLRCGGSPLVVVRFDTDVGCDDIDRFNELFVPETPTTAPTSLAPSTAPSSVPSSAPTMTIAVSSPPSPAPTADPSPAPTSSTPAPTPTLHPSAPPSALPTAHPTPHPSALPSASPTSSSPTAHPTTWPTATTAGPDMGSATADDDDEDTLPMLVAAVAVGILVAILLLALFRRSRRQQKTESLARPSGIFNNPTYASPAGTSTGGPMADQRARPDGGMASNPNYTSTGGPVLQLQWPADSQADTDPVLYESASDVPSDAAGGTAVCAAAAGNLPPRGAGSLAAYSVPFEEPVYAQVHGGGASSGAGYDMPLAVTVDDGSEAYAMPVPLAPDTGGMYATVGQDTGKEVAGRTEYGSLIIIDDGSQADPNAATPTGRAIYATLT